MSFARQIHKIQCDRHALRRVKKCKDSYCEVLIYYLNSSVIESYQCQKIRDIVCLH